MKKSKISKSASENGSSKKNSGKDFLIAGIGASAGGIQALKEFFENVPADSGVAYVVILHLSPDHESRLAEVLQTTAQIPVTQVKERVKVVPNHVYVVPPNQHLGMLDGHIVVEPNISVEERRAPIDIFFRTLAESRQEGAIAVVLSGTGADGSMGLKRVKERGGAVFVQNPREAEFSDMPRNSIATDLVDAVLNVSEIPAKIIAYKDNLGAVEIPIQPESRPENEQAALREIFAILRVRTGNDFTNYKHPTVLRRIERRINVHQLQTLAEYADYIHNNLDEAQALLKDLLISVTNFFRDKEAFELLETEIVPRLLQDKTAKDQIRVWVAGCATGEEAYSLAMLFAEQTENSPVAPKIQIFATDIDQDAIASSREGFYTLIDAADVSPERLRRFFTKDGDGFRVRRELREMVLFANHNLLKDAPFSHLDLVTCRNLLIYFNGTAQQRAMETFHFALNPGAYLFLGTSESVDGAGDLYVPINKEHRIYQSRQAVSKVAYPVPDSPQPMRYVEPNTAALTMQEQENRLLERISYSDLHQNIQVRPVLRQEDTARGFLLVLFEPAQNEDTETPTEKIIAADESIARRFEEELERTKTQLRTSVEQYEIQTEELRASNEELQAMNEELRSTAEELETSREELQSVNEELMTVNQELKIKIEEISTSNNDFKNLLDSTDIGTIFLDRSLRVKMFTPSARTVFNLIDADINRPLADITTKINFADLLYDVEKVLDTLQTVEREFETDKGRWYLMRVFPYRTMEDKISGVVATFIDITTRVRSEQALHNLVQSREQQRRIFDTTLSTITDFAYIFDKEGRFIYSNQPLLDLLDIDAEEIVGKNFFDLNYPEDLAARLQKQIQHVFNTKKPIRDETPFTSPTGAGGFYEYIFNPVFASDGSVESVAGSAHDITKFKRSEINLTFLAEISQDLAHLTSAAEIMQTVGTKIGAFFNLSVCAFTEVDEAANEATITHSWHRAGVQSLVSTYRMDEFLSTEFQRLSRAGEVFVVSDTAKDSRVDTEKYRALDVGAFVTFPVLRGGKWIFHIVMFNSQAHAWREDEIELMREITARIWTSIERRRADEALRESEEKYSQLFNSIDEGFCVIEVIFDDNEKPIDYLFLEANPAYEAQTGQKNVVGKTARQFTPNLEKIWFETFGKVATGGENVRFENEVKEWNRYYDVFGSRVGDASSCKVAVVFQDITARKQAEESLNFQAKLLDTVEQSVIATDLDGKIIYWNKFAERLYGWKAEEALGRNIVEMATADTSVEQAEEIMSQLRQGKSWSGEFSVKRRDGTTFPAQVIDSPITDVKGNLIGIVGVSVDITERKRSEKSLRESEERLRLLIESADDYAIFTVTKDNTIESWNTGAERTFGWKENEILGKNGAILFTPEDQARGVPKMETQCALETGKAEDERWHIRKDSSRFYASGVMQPLRDGGIHGFVKICRDQTDKIEAEKVLHDKEILQKLMGAQEDERKRIARDLHDELGQQLTALRFKLEAARKICEAEEVCSKIDDIQRIAKQIDADVDFLAWELRPAALDDLGLIAALENYVREWSHHAGVTAEFHASKLKKMRLAPEVEINLYRITQEALNNTHKHAQAKSASVVLEKRDDLIVLIVEDDGTGFNPKLKKNRSKGLGLIGMEERAALIGGTIEIESAPKQGTTIFIRVPATLAKKEKVNA